MLGWLLNFLWGLIRDLPILALPEGVETALRLFNVLVAYMNVFLPLARLAPILAFIVLVRNWTVIVSGLRFILRFIPFFG